MMKKLLNCTVLFLIAALSLFALTACSPNAGKYFDEVYSKYENLAAGAQSYDSEGDAQKSFSLKGKGERRNNFVTVDLGRETEFNTLTLSEKGAAVTRFSIYASHEKEANYEFLFQGDTIEQARVCFTGDTTYRYLRIFAVAVEGDYHVDQLGVYKIRNENAANLRNTAYLLIGDVTESYDLSTLDAFTDVILFGTAHFDGEGNILFSYGKDENKIEIVDQGELYAEKLAIVREKLGGRDVNLLAGIGLDMSTIYQSQTTYLENTIRSIKDFIERYDLDGYDIDYEYPHTKKEWKAYNAFLQAFQREMPDKILSIATSRFALKFDKETIDAIDRVQFMSYDDFDAHGYQSSVPTAVLGVKQLLDCGIPASKIELGVPTYSRPTNGYAFWGNYKDYVDRLGRYENLIYDNTFDHDGNPLTTPQSFNSYQTILDKTAFAIDAGLGGIMMFRVGCDASYDNPLCLARAVTDTKILRAQ